MNLSPTTFDFNLDSIDENLYWLNGSENRRITSKLFQALTQVYKCVVCQHTFKTQSGLIEHKCQNELNVNLQKSNIVKYHQCYVCGMTFYQDVVNMKHKLHKCHHCVRRFKMVSTLETSNAEATENSVKVMETENYIISIDKDLQKYI